jgi:hypothetical protein
MNIRTLLAIDAVTCLLTGTALLGLPTFVASVTGLPPILLLAGGAILLATAVLLGALARHESPPASGVNAVVVVNVCWSVGCLAALIFTDPTAWGVAFLLVQAVAVGAFAWAEWRFGSVRPRPAV